ncbi:hypothetical protein ACPF8X_09710 [Streptomyces sp. G35A]
MTDRTALITAYWDAAAVAFDDEPDHGLRADHTRAAWARLLRSWMPADALDIGCGTGMIRLQRVLLRTLRAACARAGIVWDRCGRQAQGDGYLLVFEPGIDETRVVPDLLEGLACALADANATAAYPRRVRMRAGLHQGIVHEAGSGYAGSAVVALFRFLDSDPVRRALADDPSAHLVAAFSDGLYQDLVPHGYSGLAATGFRRAEIQVVAKNFTGVAWIRALPAQGPAPAAEG